MGERGEREEPDIAQGREPRPSLPGCRAVCPPNPRRFSDGSLSLHPPPEPALGAPCAVGVQQLPFPWLRAPNLRGTHGEEGMCSAQEQCLPPHSAYSWGSVSRVSVCVQGTERSVI